jgi:hypothetical protein
MDILGERARGELTERREGEAERKRTGPVRYLGGSAAVLKTKINYTHRYANGSFQYIIFSDFGVEKRYYVNETDLQYIRAQQQVKRLVGGRRGGMTHRRTSLPANASVV